ncbi:hypothetical protein A7U60_g8103 [Sanghuangporus baumii]|uniref:Mitochondrial ATPase complex subunit ATP10 n=1 Tax=Sanghuangporus baumii TaxID=108892 RepID=A0A9Q5HRX4_SANBA|nr:hypothetical protein A7U60_g8103 [Sanghuangporus baumii]
MLPRALSRHSARRIATEIRVQRAGLGASAVRSRRYKSTETTVNGTAGSSSPTQADAPTASSSAAPIDQASFPESGTLPYLPQPLGVPDLPTTFRKSWRDETMELMNQDVRLARRKHIVKEATRGYFHDLNATRKHGGKTWIAPRTLIREDHALYFPDISGSCLAGSETVHTTNLCKGKVSVIAMLSTAISEEHVDSFVRETNEAFLSNPHYRFVQINLQENYAKALLVSLYVSSLRRNIPKELHPTYILSRQNMEYVREPLRMNNKHIGFVYLLDSNLKVRWAGGGLALPSEAESLKRCTKVLLDRMGKGNASAGK